MKASVLYVTNKLPWPPLSGGHLREAELLARLAKTYQISLVVASKNPEHDISNRHLAEHRGLHVEIFARSPSEERGLPRRVRMNKSDSLAAFLAEELPRFDMVHVEGYFLMDHIPHCTDVPVCLCEENVEFEIVRQMFPNAEGTDEPCWEHVLEVERRQWHRAAVIVALTEADRTAMAGIDPGSTFVVVPNGADHVLGEPRMHRGKGQTVTYLGNYGWGPTRDGALRMLNAIWPGIHAADGARRLQLLGSGIDEELLAIARDTPGVLVLGEVDSVGPYLSASDVVVCPIATGSGAMVKVAEALRTGAVLVASKEALRGLPHDANTAVRLATSDEHFTNCVHDLLVDPPARSALARRAFEVGTQLPTWDEAARKLATYWDELLSRTRGRNSGIRKEGAPS